MKILNNSVEKIEIRSWHGNKYGEIHSTIKVSFSDNKDPFYTPIIKSVSSKYPLLVLACYELGLDYKNFDFNNKENLSRVNNFVTELLKLNSEFVLTIKNKHVDRKRDLMFLEDTIYI